MSVIVYCLIAGVLIDAQLLVVRTEGDGETVEVTVDVLIFRLQETVDASKEGVHRAAVLGSIAYRCVRVVEMLEVLNSQHGADEVTPAGQVLPVALLVNELIFPFFLDVAKCRGCDVVCLITETTLTNLVQRRSSLSVATQLYQGFSLVKQYLSIAQFDPVYIVELDTCVNAGAGATVYALAIDRQCDRR